MKRIGTLLMLLAMPVGLAFAANTIVDNVIPRAHSAADGGGLACTVRTVCATGEVEVFGMSSTSNAHAGTPGGSSYGSVVCCGGVEGLGTSCSGVYDAALTLSGPDNAHVASDGSYATEVCLSGGDDATVDCTYGTTCPADYACLATVSGSTNAHVADCDGVNDYATKVCCRVEAMPTPTPDLIETAVSNPPASLNRGTKFSVTDTAKNQGGQQAGPSYTRYYLSTDKVRDPADKLLTGTRSVRALAPGATSTGTKSVTIPGNTALGTYYLLACADDTLLVIESDETNNCIASASTIQVTAPDLRETALTNPPASVKQGGSFNVTDTTTNVGTGPAGASTTRYYLSLDKIKGAGDVLLTGSRAVPALAAGASSAGTAGVTVPVATPLGTYYLLACADDLKVVKESKEGNNCRASASKVQVTGP